MAELKYNGNTVNSVVSQITNIAGKFDPLANTVKTSTGLMIGRKGFEIINPGLVPESICQAVGTCSEALGALVKEIRTKQVAILTYSQDKDEINAFVDSLSRLEYDSLDLSGIDSKISTWKKLSFAAKGIFASVGTFAAGFVEGAANFVETAVDTAAVVATGAASIFTKPYDLIAGTNITDEMWDSTKAYVAEEQVASIADQFYANTEAGQWLKENAYGFDTVRGIGKGVGYSTTMILAGNVFAGAGGVDATVKAARLAKALPAMSGVLGFGNASEEGWGNGATTEKGLTYGVAGGAWEAVQWGAGVKISSLGSHIDDIAKVGAKQVFKDAGKRVMFDTVDSALEGFAQPTLTMIYRKYDGESFGQQWANAFETNGGWNGVLQQAVIGGVMSGASEAGDVFKYTREVAKSKKSGGGSGEGNKTTTPPGGSKSEEVFRKEGGGEQEARVETQENSNLAVVENGESNKAVVEQQATDTKAKKPVEQQAADTNAKKPVEQQATDKNANKSPMQKKPADPAPKQPVAPSPAKTTPKNNGGGKGAGVENHAAAVAPASQNVRVETQSNVDPNAKVNSPVTQVAPVKPAVETNARVNNQSTQNATVKPAVDPNASVANPVTQTAPVKPAVDTNARVAGQTQAAPIKPVTEGGANATINSSTPARLGTDNPANLAAGLSSMVGDGKISGSDVSKAGVGVATMAGLGKLGTGMRASSMDADFNVDVKLKGETEIASARTSRQLSGDLEKMSKSLPTKQAKVEAAQTKLNNYRTEAGDAADPKVIKKLEGEVNKAQADYDKQLSRVKEKAEQRNDVATQEIDEKLASGSTKGLVGTERGKLVDGEFTKDRAKVISEIDKKEFSKLLDDTYGKVDKTKVDEFGNPKEIKLDDPVVTDVVNADGTTSRHIIETDNVVRDVLLDKDGNVINEIVTKPDGSSSTFEVTPEKTIKTNLDKDGNLDSIVEFNSDGTTVIQKFNEDGSQSVGSFDANKNLKELKVANEEGKLEITSKYEYDSKGKLISQFDEYSDGSATVRVTGADNSVGISKFDSKGHLLESKITGGDGNVVSHTKNTFDQDGKFVSSVEKFEDGTSRTEDVRPSGYHETTVMDSNGRVLERKITDAEDNLVLSTNNTFDANGKLISCIERYSDGSSKVINTGADGSLGVGKFDSKGHLLESEITDGDGNVISSSKYTYDESGKLVSRVENNGPAADDINAKYGITDNEDYDSIMAKMDKAVEDGKISRQDADSLIERVAEEQHFDEKAEIARLREENAGYEKDRQANIERKELLVTQDGAKAENVKGYDEAVRQIDDQIKANNDKIAELEANIKEKPVEVQPEAVEKPVEVQPETVEKPVEVHPETVVKPDEVQAEDINSKYGITDNEDYDSIMAKMDKAVEDGRISREDADSLIERVAEEQHFDEKAEIARLREENVGYEKDRQANIDRKGLLVTQDGAKAENVKGYDEAVRQIDDQIKSNNTKIAELEKEINTPITRLGVDNTETKLTTDTLINNPDIEPDVVALGNAAAAVTTIGRLGTDVVAKGGDVTVKSTNTETSTRTSKQLGADLEKLSTGLSDKQAKLDTAKANLDKYKAEMGDAADPKVVKKLEGEVDKAQSEYDKQLVKVKDKAEQRNATAAKEIDEKLASGSTKGLVGTEKGKIVDGEFTTESATAKGEISKKEFATETATRESLMRNDEAVEVKATDTVSDEVKAKFGITENENYDSLINKLEKAVESGELTKEAADDIFYKIAEEQHFDANDRIDALRAENAAYARDRQANIERKELLVTQDGAKAESVKGYDEAVRQIDERINSNNEEISRINQETGAVGSDSSTKVEGESNLDVIDTESLDAKFDRLSDEITSDINRTYGENAEVVRTETEIKPEDSKVVTTATQESEVKDVPLSPAQQRAKEAELELEAKKKQLETELAADAKAEEVQLEKLRTESEQRLQEAHDADQRKLAEMEKDLEDTIRTENERIAQEEAAKNNGSVISPDKNYTMKKADEGSVQAEKKVAETTSSNYKKMSEALDKARQSSNGEVVIDGKTYKASEITPDTMTAKREATSRVEQDLASVRKKADEGSVRLERKGTETISSNYKKISDAIDKARQSSNGEVVVDGKTYKASEITPDTMTAKREITSRVEQDLASVRKKADEGSVRTEKKGTETTSLNYKKMSEALDNARQSIRADEEVVINGVTYKAADVVAQIAALKNGDNSPVVAPSSEYAMKKANDPTTKGGKVSEYLDRQKSEVRSGVEAHKKEVAAVVKEVKNKADAEPDTRLSADEQRIAKKRQEADRRKAEMTAKQEANREKMKTEVEQAQAESAKRISEQQTAADKKITEMESEVKARKEVDAQEEARFAKEQERLKAEINRVETAEVVAPVSYSDRMKLADDLCANLGDDYAVGMHGIGMRSGDQDPNVVMNSIAQNGLEVRNNRTVHGTVEFFGRLGSNRADVTRNIDNYAYGGGNQVIIATPTTIKNANGEMIYIGGPNTKSSIVDYSRGGYDTTSLGDKCLVVDGKVPSEFVYGYFTDNPDGSVEFHPNPNHVSKTGGVVTDATFNHSKETLSREFNSDLTKLLSSKPSEAMLPEAMKVYDGLQKKLENPSFFNDPADIKRDMETVLQYQNDCKGKVDATRPVDAPTAEVKNDTIVKPEETVVRTEEDTTIKPEETRVENVSEEAVVRAEEDTTVKQEETRVESGREEAVVRTEEDTTVKPVETRVESDDARVKIDEQLARLTKEHDAEVDRIKQKQEQDIDAARRDKNRQLMDEEARYNDEVARLKKQHARHDDDLSLYRGENATGVKATERQLKQKYEGLYEERLYNLKQQHKSRMADIESRGNATIRNIESRYSEDIKVVDKMLQDVKTDVANGNLTGQALGAKKLISDYDNFVRRQSEYDADRRAIIDRYNAQKADVENAYRGDMNSLENFNEQARSVVRRGEMEPTYYLERAGLDGICDRNGLKKLEVFFDEESVFVRRLYEGDSEFVLRNKNNRIAELDARMNQELRDLETRYRESGMDVTDQYKKYEMAIESDDISQDALKALDKQLEMDELLADFTDDSVAVERIQSLRKGIEEKIGVQTDSSVRVTPQETSSTPVELKQDVPVQKIVNADEAATVSPVATRTASDPIVTKYTGKDGSSYRQQINPDGSRIESNYNNKGELINQKTIDKNGAYSTYELGTDGSKTTSNFAKDGTLISSKVVHKNGITEVTFKSDFNDTYSYSKVDSKGDFIEQRFTTQKGDDVHIKYNPDRSSYSHVVGADGTIKDMTYDSNNNIIRHTEKRPDGTVIDSRYKDKIITDQSVSKPDGSRIVYSKNSEGATTTTYDADGYPIKVESVDSSGTKVTTDQFQNGNYRKNVVDKSGKLLEEVVYTNGETTTTTYGADNTKTIRTEKNGRFTQTKYDANGDKVEFSYDSDDGTVHKTEYVSKDVRIYNSYYTDGRVSETVINKDGSYTTTTFNKDKKPIEIIDSSADKVVTYTKFNEDGSSSISTINKDNQVVDIVETSADKVVTHTKVNDDGTKLVHVKEPNGYETQVLYSRDNKPINAFENKLDGTFVNKRFDGDGNLIETISTAKSGTVTVETRHTDGSTTTKVTASDDSLVETVMKDKNGKVTREVSEYQNGTKYDKVINPDGSSSVKVLNPDKTYDIRKLDSNGKLVERQWTTKDGTIRTQTPLPDGTAKRHTVDANGNVRDSILRGNTLLEQVETRPDGSKQLYKVNSDGSRTYTEIDPNGGKNITIRKPDNTFETTVLDSKGRIIEERWSDKNGRITTERPNGDGTFSRRVVESDRRVIDSVMDKYGNIIRQTDRGPDGTTTTYVRNSDGTYDRRTVNKDNKLLAREYKDSAGTLRVEKANGDGTYSRRTTKRDGTVSDTVFSRSGEILHRIENRPDKSKIITERTADGGKVVTEISKDGVSVRHVYDKYGNEVRPQPNVRQQPQQTGQRQSIFDRLRRQQPQAQPQQMPIFRNAQEVISSIRNPLDDNYDKIFRRLFDGNSESFYDKLVSVNTKSAKIQPNVQSIKKFHDTFDLDSSRGKRYVNSRGDYIYHQYGYFDHVRSQDFIGGTDRLYLNIPDFNQTYKFCELFAAECKNRGIPYYFKTASADNVRIIKRKQLFRDEAVVIYSGKEYLSDYVNIASDIVSKYGIKLEEPPILAGRLKNNIGYGAEPDGNYVGFGKYSYNSLRSEIIEKAVINLKLDYERRGLDINSNRYYTDLKNLIIEYGKEVGISPDNFCNNIEEIY